MKNYFFILIFAGIFHSVNLCAEEKVIEEIIVSSSLIGQSMGEISNPLHLIDRESVANDATQSLGEMIGGLLGVLSSDYGAAVGQPIIRGISGSRVKVLNNGMVVRDVSSLGGDHANETDLNHLQQIEIVRGPSSLLYAHGTIGGIINIVDNTIAKKDFEASLVNLGGEVQSVNDGHSSQFTYQGNLSGLNASFAYSDFDFGNYDIPDGTSIHKEHEEGFLNNSDFGNAAKKIGLSNVGDWGFAGFSYADSKSVYGIPFHGEEEEEHEDERIFTSTDSKTLTLKGAYNIDSALVRSIDYHYRDTDYTLTEQSAEEDHGSTMFDNDAQEFGLKFDLSSDHLTQKLVANFNSEKFLIVGEEVFMPQVSSDEITLGYYLSKKLSFAHFYFGVRHDQVKRDGSIAHAGEGAAEDIRVDKSATSFALSLSRDLTENIDVNFGLSSVVRMPSSVELFINGPHLATQRFEAGNINLASERSNNIDLAFNFTGGEFVATLAFFRNHIDEYIYLMDEAEEPVHGGLIGAVYTQQNAEFNGYELEISRTFKLHSGQLTLSYGRDDITSKFSNGDYVPRSVPGRNLFNISYAQDNDLKFVLSLKDVAIQNNIAENETQTRGYQMLDARLEKVFQLGSSTELTLSLYGKNLLDEVARNHTSFVKDQVPLPGRNYGLKFNLSF